MEALILFFVIFFPGVFAFGFSGGVIETIPFMPFRELNRILTHTIPMLALLWYIILGKKQFFAPKTIRIKKQDLFSFFAGFTGLVLIGLCFSSLASFFSANFGLPPPPMIEGPTAIYGWVIVFFTCLGIGYLEESYFRYYLLSKLKYTLHNPVIRVIFATVLFAICHIYAGPWAVINAFFAGILLSVLFIRYGSFHGIALAHSFYNFFVFLAVSFST